jgi:hypothetical protein
VRYLTDDAPVSLTEYAARFDLEDSRLPGKLKTDGSGHGYQRHTHRKDSMRRGNEAQAARRAAAKAAAV